MFEIIGVIIYYMAIAAWWGLKFTLKAIYYTLPIWFVFFGFFIGGLMGDGCFGSLADDYRREMKKEFSHEVIIYWDEAGTDYTKIIVREDLNWCLNNTGSVNYETDLYYSFNYGDSSTLLPNKATRPGFVFKGLYDMAFGNGEQYVTEKGYSLRRITEDMELYAFWMEAEVA